MTAAALRGLTRALRLYAVVVGSYVATTLLLHGAMVAIPQLFCGDGSILVRSCVPASHIDVPGWMPVSSP